MTTRGQKNERGASAVEYGLIVALCAVAFILGIQAIGLVVGGFLNNCAAPGIAQGYTDPANNCPGDPH